LEPSRIEDYIDVLIELGEYTEAAKCLAKICNDTSFKSLQGRSHYQLWTMLADICCEHPKEIKHIRVDQILRAGAKKFSDQAGKIWCALARYWIALGQFEKVSMDRIDERRILICKI
jgi:pre-mRNA-splicing factor SYF1